MVPVGAEVIVEGSSHPDLSSCCQQGMPFSLTKVESVWTVNAASSRRRGGPCATDGCERFAGVIPPRRGQPRVAR